MKKQKSFDCVELQRSIRNKFVDESEMDLSKFFILIQEKKNKSIVYKKLVSRKVKQITTE